MKKALNKAGVKEKMYEAYTKGDKDFNSLVSKMKANQIDVVYVGGYHTEAGLILRQMRGQGMKSQMISGDALATNEFWSITGAAGEGMMFTFGADPRKRPAAAAIVKKFKDKGVDPEGYTLYTYAAMQIWSQAATKAKTTDGKKVAADHQGQQVGHGAGPDQLRQEGRHHHGRLRVLQMGQGRQLRRDPARQGLVSSNAIENAQARLDPRRA